MIILTIDVFRRDFYINPMSTRSITLDVSVNTKDYVDNMAEQAFVFNQSIDGVERAFF